MNQDLHYCPTGGTFSHSGSKLLWTLCFPVLFVNVWPVFTTLLPRVRRHNTTHFEFSESSVISLFEKKQDNSESILWYSLMYWTGFPLLNYLKWSLLLTLIGLLIGKCLVLFLIYLLFWYLLNNSFKNSVLIYFTLCFHGGFDNNGAIIGPRSTRHSNPEEHATYYFTTFSKDLLVQVMELSFLLLLLLYDHCSYSISNLYVKVLPSMN